MRTKDILRLALAAGCDPRTIRRFIRGTRVRRWRHLLIVEAAKALNIDLSETGCGK